MAGTGHHLSRGDDGRSEGEPGPRGGRPGRAADRHGRAHDEQQERTGSPAGEAARLPAPGRAVAGWWITRAARVRPREGPGGCRVAGRRRTTAARQVAQPGRLRQGRRHRPEVREQLLAPGTAGQARFELFRVVEDTELVGRGIAVLPPHRTATSPSAFRNCRIAVYSRDLTVPSGIPRIVAACRTVFPAR